MAEEVDWAVGLAIEEAVKAGVFWRAARLNPLTRDVWEALAAPHSQKVTSLLDDAMTRLDPGGVRPCSRLK